MEKEENLAFHHCLNYIKNKARHKAGLHLDFNN